MATKPWAGAIFPPSNWKESNFNPEPPAESLALEYIYGYRGYDSTDNAWYLDSGEVVYPVAAACVVYNRQTKAQRHYLGHNDDVICLTMHPTGKVVASGQVGHDPRVLIWDPATLKTIASVGGCYERAISCLAFNCDGTRLAAADMAEMHKVVVHEMKGEQVAKIGAKETGGNPIVAIKWHPTDPNQFVTIAKDTLTFWNIAGSQLESKRGLVGTVAPLQPLLSVDYMPTGAVVAGTASGQLYVWPNGAVSLGQALQAHQASVFATSRDSDGLWTCGKDGKIRKWDKAFKQVSLFDLRKVCTNFEDKMGRPLINNNSGKVIFATSLRHSNDGKLLVGTSTCELFEIDIASEAAAMITQGHSKGETWGLAMHPHKLYAVSVGEDKTLRVLSLKSKQLTAVRALPQGASCAGFNPDGSLLAIGLVDGGFMVVKSETLEDVFHAKPRKERISQTKFSPNGRFLAVGSHDNFIDIFDASRDFKLLATCTGHNSFITHLDFSADSEVIRSNCGAYELLFWKTRTGQQLKEPSKLRDKKWETQTCILGFQVQGIWGACWQGNDVNALDVDKIRSLMITSDDYGMVNLFRFPAPKPGESKCKRYGGHSAHVTNARFSFDDHYVVSTGGGDKSVMQWRVLGEGQNSIQDLEEPSDVKEELSYQYTSNRSFKKMVQAAPEQVAEESTAYCALPDDEPSTTEAAAPGPKPKPTLPGTWFSAVNPWLGAVFPPTNHPAINDQVPAAECTLEYVHGIREHDARENLFFLKNGHLVFHAAGVGIVMDPQTRKQQFFLGHTDDILALTLHPDGKTVATAQVGKDPAIIIWDATTMQQVKILKGFHQRAVTSLGFSPDGKWLCSVGMDDYHSLAVWDWNAEKLVATTRVSGDKVFDINFSPFNPNHIVTCGVKHISFWNIEGPNKIKGTKGTLEGLGKIQTMNCMAFPAAGFSLIGTASGDIYIFKETGLLKYVSKAHIGGVTSLWTPEKGGAEVWSAGADGVMRKWKWVPEGDLVPEADKLDLKIHGEAAPLKARAITRKDNMFAIGTLSSELITVDIASKKLTVLLRGHSAGETWGLAADPSQPRFATCGDDKTVRLFDANNKEQVAMCSIPDQGSAVGWSHDGKLLAVGMDHGQVTVLSATDFKVIVEKHDRKEEISDVKFSPDGTMLAVGSHDNFVDVYQVSDWKKLGTCVGHSSYITHLDWSTDSNWLQSTCGAYELLFWDAHKCTQEVWPSKLADTIWATWTCVLGWPVQGIWPKGADGTDVNACARSQSKTLLATGDDFGQLKLFNYPCVKPGSRFKKYIGHSAHVTNVTWLHGDAKLITTGGGDRTIMQWAVKF